MNKQAHSIKRRGFLQAAVGVGAFSAGIQLHLATAQAAAKVVVKYDWLISNGQIGDVVAIENGYFKDAGLEVEFSPGGPNSATVPPVVSGAATLGQFSETAQLFNARANGVPVDDTTWGKLKALGEKYGFGDDFNV